MTFLATWPASNASPAGCDAFDTERAALAWAQRLTARWVPSVVVYEVDDERISSTEARWPRLGPARTVAGPTTIANQEVVSGSTDDPQGPQIEETGNA